MTAFGIEEIAHQDVSVQTALLELNNAHAIETSYLAPEKWQWLLDTAYRASCVNGSAALLISFDQDANYDNANFSWFCDRYSSFVYVDRIVVADDFHGQGIGGLLYRDLTNRARLTNHQRIVCEVNLIPANPASDAFHLKQGFSEIGRANLETNGKTVRYFEKRL